MPPSSFFLSTAEVEPLRKLRSRFSHIYVHTLVTEIDRRTTRKSKFSYDIDTTISRSNISEIQFFEGWSVHENERSSNFEQLWRLLWDTGVPYDTQSRVYCRRVSNQPMWFIIRTSWWWTTLAGSKHVDKSLSYVIYAEAFLTTMTNHRSLNSTIG